MIRSAVTVSLVPEAKWGPFVFWEDLPRACGRAKELGFDAVEVFAPGPDAVPAANLQRLLSDHGLQLAAVGTGAGWVKHRKHLCLPEAASRQAAKDFIEVDRRYIRPAEVNVLLGDASKARAVLNWRPRTTIEQLVAMMVDADLELARREKTLRDAGHDVDKGPAPD